jgi:RES domain-containing protein
VLRIDFPDECLRILPQQELPDNWREYPTLPENQAIGDRWVREGRSLALRVPSAVTLEEYNFLINPLHPDFARVTIHGPLPLDVDARVFKR